MTSLSPGNIAIGLDNHYIEIITPTGTLVDMVHITDLAHGGADSQQYIMGLTVNARTSDIYCVSTPDPLSANCPHDLVWLPDNSGVIVAVVPSSGNLELRKYGFDGAQIGASRTGLSTDTGWAQQTVKIDVACDSSTIYYTDSLASIFTYDFNTSTQGPIYDTLPTGSPYIYGGLKLLSPGFAASTHGPPLEIGPVIVVAMTVTGDGPSRAVCLGADRTLWTDEINVGSGSYHVVNRQLTDGTLINQYITQSDPMGTNGPVLSLACYANKCSSGQVFGSVY